MWVVAATVNALIHAINVAISLTVVRGVAMVPDVRERRGLCIRLPAAPVGAS